jgi:hypothetical protein
MISEKHSIYIRSELKQFIVYKNEINKFSDFLELVCFVNYDEIKFDKTNSHMNH